VYRCLIKIAGEVLVVLRTICAMLRIMNDALWKIAGQEAVFIQKSRHRQSKGHPRASPHQSTPAVPQHWMFEWP